MLKRLPAFLLVLLLCATSFCYAQNYSNYQQQFVDEHLYGGFPGYDNIYVRQAYIMSYSHEHRIPNWVAYHVVPDYMNIVPRYGRFSAFRTDWNIPNPVADHEYNNLYDGGRGYARGHLAPFNISGGDRDGDLLYGVVDANGDGLVDEEDMKGRELAEYTADADELSRVYEINYLSNIVPQDQDGFNGGSGIWRDLERYVQETVVEGHGRQVWIMAGPVFGKGEMERVGPDSDITVAPMFFKIVVREDEEGNPLVLAFLMPHHREPHGNPEGFLVSVDIVEALTDLDFFRGLEDKEETELERQDTWVNWEKF